MKVSSEPPRGAPAFHGSTIRHIFVLTALAYSRAQDDDPGLTTEIALVVTALLGGLAMTRPALAAGLVLVIAAAWSGWAFPP